ncbi:UNVERIFIED_CONTAM: hypothetical protein FKN15_074182 [Acipenser sinensis]
MTAAHCVDSPQGKVYRVALGDHNLFENDGSEIIIPVDKIIVHELWDPTQLGKGNDIAMLRLKTPAFDNGYVKLGSLPAYDEIIPHNQGCYITGWGLTQSGGSIPAVLQEAILPVVEYPICSRDDWWAHFAKNTMVCAGGDGFTAGCQGDSGGPLNCFSDGVWKVQGIVSFGPAPYCNTFMKPTVFTRVSAFMDWIYNTQDLMRCSSMCSVNQSYRILNGIDEVQKHAVNQSYRILNGIDEVQKHAVNQSYRILNGIDEVQKHAVNQSYRILNGIDEVQKHAVNQSYRILNGLDEVQ